MLSDILLLSLTPYVYEVFGDYHCEIWCIRLVLGVGQVAQSV
jgi:hypothetical protein